MKLHPPVLNRKLRATRAGLLCTALLAATAFTAHAQNTGFGTTTPASKVTVNGNFAVGKPPVIPSGPKSPYITTAAPVGGAIIEGLTGVGVLFPTNQFHVFAAADPVRFEGLQFSTDLVNDVPLVTTPQGVVKKAASIGPEFIQIQSQMATENYLFAVGQDVNFGNIELAKDSPSNLFSYTPTSITLKANRTYKLTFNINYVSRGAASGGGTILYRFFNQTDGVFFGPDAFAGFGAGGDTDNINGDVTAFITTTKDTTVSLRVKEQNLTYIAVGVSTGSAPNRANGGAYLTVETLR